MATGLPPVVIWTPRFIVFFSLTLVLGLTLESLLTQAWSIRWFTGTWIFMGHIVAVSICWIALLVTSRSRSRWLRTGALFGLIWAAFMAINIVVQAILVQPSGYLLAHINAASSLALLGCYLCLSIDRLPTNRWDAWFLSLIPAVGAVLVGLLYFLRADRSFFGLENAIIIVALILSVLVWWMRLVWWKHAPGPTFLLGVVPLIVMILYIGYVRSSSFNLFPVHVTLTATATLSSRETVFFFSQVALLGLLLGTMRLVKSAKDDQPET